MKILSLFQKHSFIEIWKLKIKHEIWNKKVLGISLVIAKKNISWKLY